jgi:hypothetical protein
MRMALSVALLAAGLFIGGCDAGNDGPNINLDSAGSKIERGAEKVGNELDTAFTGLKTQVNESQIEGSLHRLQGMDGVEVELSPEGAVHLTGTVATEESRRLAEEIVRNIKGVASVRNDLTIGPGGDTMRLDTARADSVKL